MRLVLEKDPAILTVRRYAPGEIEIGSEILRAPCILSPRQLIRDWAVTRIEALTIDELEPLLAFSPSIVILGSNVPQARAPFELRRALEARAVALEVMSLGAACRTYNVLAQELRPVVAGLLP